MIWFINGKIGFGSPCAGRRFWGEGDEFINGAADFFDDTNLVFPELDYGFFSTCHSRNKQGYYFAKEQLEKIAAAGEQTHHLVAFSMGCAFAEGMAEALGESGLLGKTVHINPFQAADIEVLDRKRFVIAYQLMDDPVINNRILRLAGIAKPGKIKGTTMDFIEKTDFRNFRIIHRSPIWFQKEKFWERLSAMVYRECAKQAEEKNL